MVAKTKQQYSVLSAYLKSLFTLKISLIQKILFILFLLLNHCNGLSCSASSSNSNAITTELGTFSSYAKANTYGVKSGSVSNSMYFLYILLFNYHSAVRKENQDGSSAWMAAFSSRPLMKSLSVTPNEQHVLFGWDVYPLDILRLSTNDGAIVDSQRL